MINIRKQVLLDTLKIMYPSIILEALNDILSKYLVIFIAQTLGKLSNVILVDGNKIESKDIAMFIAAAAISIIGIPLYNIYSKTFMFKLALRHDRLVINRFMRKDYDEYSKYELGEISYRLERDPNNLRFSVIDIFKNILSVSVIATIIIILMIRVNRIYAIICMLTGGTQLLIAFFSGKLDAKYIDQIKEYESINRALEADMCKNYTFIKGYKLKSIIVNKFENMFTNYYEKVIKRSINYNCITNMLNDISSYGSIITVLIFGAWFVSIKKINPGDVVSMLLYLDIIKSLYMDLSVAIKQVAILPQLLDNVKKLYPIKERIGGICIKEFNNISCNNISFSFEDGRKVLDNICLTIKKGEKIAIVGKNGSGKSTFLKIIAGLYSNWQGEIKINNTNFSEVDLTNWRYNLVYMSQKPYIFNNTVINNVWIAELNSNEKNVNSVLERVGLTMLSNQVTGQFGENLSGGEIQKISIARVMLKKADLILMDEPSNNLDTEGKNLINEILSDKEKTVIFITHDDELLHFADSILYL